MDIPKVKLKVKTSLTLKLNKKQAQALRMVLNDCDIECYNQSDYLYELRNQLNFLDD